MNKTIGYSDTLPLIKKILFPTGKIELQLADGRIITLPINKFPEIEKLTKAQRLKHKTLAGMGIMFDDCDTVFHVSDFLGKTFSIDAYPVSKRTNKSYSLAKDIANEAAEPKANYKKK